MAPRLLTGGIPAVVLALAACGAEPASVVAGGSVHRGAATVTEMGCGSCHTIAGITGAHGQVGPPLTGVGGRAILAGELPNTPANMIRWVRDPQAVEPATAMPNLGVTEQQARDIAAYLYTLR
jgi:cytochrome c2